MAFWNNNVGGASYGGLGMPIQGSPYFTGGMPGGRPDGYSGIGTPGYGGEAPTMTASNGNGPQADSAESTALSYLTGVVGGQNTPYDQNTQNNLFSQASNMNASAEATQNQAIQGAAARGGASANDPSAQLAQRQTMAQRQGANQQAMGQIQSQANIANQRTQQQAANSLLNHADERYAIQNGNNQRMAQTALGFLYGGGGGGRSNTQGNSTGGMLGIGQENSNLPTRPRTGYSF